MFHATTQLRGQLLDNQQHRGVNFTLSNDTSKQETDPRANMALCVWEALEQRVIIQLAGGAWSMHRSGANEDTYPLLVIWQLDAESTYLPFISTLRFLVMASG